MRTDWAALPEGVTTGIADRVGGSDAVPASAGDHAEIAATVTGQDRAVFVKAASSEFGVRSLRYELLVSEAVDRPYSPAVEWHFEADGWLVVGLEYLDGRHADLSPGSPDLDLLHAALASSGGTPAPDVRLHSPQSRLGFAHPAMDGTLLLHTDLTSTNLIVTRHGLRIVDWAMATKAVAWVELALLVQWLIGSGHRPAQAEEWLARHPAWTATAPGVLDDFASRNASKWSLKAERNTAGWVRDLAGWTRSWAEYRRGPSLK